MSLKKTFKKYKKSLLVKQIISIKNKNLIIKFVEFPTLLQVKKEIRLLRFNKISNFGFGVSS